MFTRALHPFRHHRGKRLASLGVALVLVAAPMVLLPGMASATIADSPFDGSDRVIDHVSLVGPVNPDKPSGSLDDSYAGGTKEDTTCPDVTTGSIPPNKADLTGFYVATAKGVTSGDTYLYLGWTRTDTLGTVTLDFELNKSSEVVDCNGVNPTRSVGDLLFTYDFQGGRVDAIEYRTWGGTEWGAPVDIFKPGVSEGSISDDLLSGEMVIDMDAAGIFSRDACVNFADAFVKSRSSSSSFENQLKDFIAPVPSRVSNCGSLKVTKIVSGGVAGVSFSFTVDCGDVDLTDASFSLVDKGSKEFGNIPFGTQCSVTETPDASKWTTSYSVDSGASDDATTASGIIIAPGTTSVVFTNVRKTGTLTIRKTAVGGTGTFRFDVDCSDNRFDRTGDNAVVIVGPGTGTVTGIPTGTTCKVTEQANPLFTSTLTSSTNEVTITTGGAEVSFTNTAKPVGITLDKKVNGGDHASEGDAFLAHAGDALNYSVVITNSGQVPLTITGLSDTLQPGFAASCSQGIGSTLAPGASITCSYPATAGSEAHNVATVTAIDGLQRPANASDGTYVHILAPSISVTKTGPANVHVGDSVDYTIVVTNTGNTPLHNVSVSDPKCDDTPTTSDDDGELSPGESWTYHCSRVAQEGDGSSILNTAVAHGTDPLGKTVDATANAATNILRPVIEVTKSGPAKAHVGDTLTYDIVVHNAGNTGLSSVVVTDTGCTGLASADADGGLGVGESWTYHCTHVVADGDGNQYVNTAHVSGQDLLEQVVTDDASWATDILRPVVEVTKTGRATAHVGDVIDYMIVVHNAGNTPLSSVQVSDAGCTGLASTDADGGLGVGETWTYHCTHVVADGDGNRYVNTVDVSGQDSLSRTVTDTATWPTDIIRPAVEVSKSGAATGHVGDTVTYTIVVSNAGNTPLSSVQVSDAGCTGLTSSDADGQLGVEESWTYHCTHVLADDDGDRYVNTVDVSGSDALGGTVTDEALWPTDIIRPAIEVSKSGAATGHVGDTVTYTIVVSNAGNTPLSSVQVSDAGCTGLASDDADGELGVEESWTYHCTHVLADDEGDRYVNTVEVSGQDSLEEVVTDEDSWPTDILKPAITITKTGPARLHVGETAAYTMVVTNAGNTDLMSVEVADPKCDSAPVSDDDDEVLSPGESWTFHCSRVIQDGDGNQILNTATVEGTDSLGEIVDAEANHPSSILRPAIAITKSAATIAHVGDAVVYTLVVTNPGNTPLASVTVTDPKCDGLPIRSGTDADGLLSPDEAWTYRCTHIATAADGASILNTAKAEGTDLLGQTVNSTADHRAAVIHPAISIVKTANPESVSVSGPVTYTYVVTNTGDVGLFNVLLTDDILGAIGSIGQLGAGESITWSKTVDVDASTPPRNIGTAVGIDPLGQMVSASDDAVITVVLGVVLAQPELPRTGSPLQAETRAALAMIQVGVVLTLAGRRRRVARRAV